MYFDINIFKGIMLMKVKTKNKMEKKFNDYNSFKKYVLNVKKPFVWYCDDFTVDPPYEIWKIAKDIDWVSNCEDMTFFPKGMDGLASSVYDGETDMDEIEHDVIEYNFEDYD